MPALRPLSRLVPAVRARPAVQSSPFSAIAARYNASSSSAGTVVPDPTPLPSSASPPKLKRPLTANERLFLDRALRVNQAGELGANLIYMGQYAVFKSSPRLRPLIRHMWDQEIHHLDTFDALLSRHRVRPTAMRPLWNVAGYALGLGTALMGEKAAMACTEAVETEIGTHYNNQLRVLLGMLKDEPGMFQGLGEEGGELRELVETVRRFRDDELEHLDTAVEHDARNANGYELLHHLIRGGCKAAIYVSERV